MSGSTSFTVCESRLRATMGSGLSQPSSSRRAAEAAQAGDGGFVPRQGIPATALPASCIIAPSAPLDTVTRSPPNAELGGHCRVPATRRRIKITAELNLDVAPSKNWDLDGDQRSLGQ